MSDKKVIVGQLLKGGKGVAAKVNPLDAINNISEHITQWKTIKETERTKREAITAQRDVMIANIEAERDAFITIVREQYKERAMVYEELFKRLDKSLESGHVEMAELALAGIVEQIKSNPLPKYSEFRSAISIGKAIDF